MPTIVSHELKFRPEFLPLGNRRDIIYLTITDLVSRHGDRIPPVGNSEAAETAIIRAQQHRVRRKFDLGNALIARTIKVSNLAITTSNIRDFEYLELELINPWQSLELRFL